VDDEACTAPQYSGTCDADFEVWWHDPELGLCVPLVYGGCGSNANRHATRDDCLARCPSRDGAVDVCEQSAECTLHPAGCCDPCEPVSPRDFVALRADRVDDYDEHYECGPIACAGCEFVPAPERVLPYLYATCAAGQCTVRDVREQPLSECSTDADCTLRCGTGCCTSCGSGEDVVALSVHADWQDDFCGPNVPPCPLCDCVIPDRLSATCDDGHCQVAFEPVCTGAAADCNDDPTMSAIAGECDIETGTCVCDTGRTMNPLTGKCY
jgi:hypothetical protein